VVRDSAQGHPVLVILAVSGGEGDAQHARGGHGIVKEHLVEVAEPIEKDGVLMLRLDRKVLLHHGGDLDGGGCGLGHK